MVAYAGRNGTCLRFTVQDERFGWRWNAKLMRGMQWLSNVLMSWTSMKRRCRFISKYRTLIDSPDCASVLLTRKRLECAIEVCSPRVTVYRLDTTTVTSQIVLFISTIFVSAHTFIISVL
ncbi:hypothetical protein BDR04DRAFT_1100013 [Suillus decipiens]|nr:hypothetical protein BDR04DRAFT_1100013 [Suillus decipiens]